MSVRFENVHNPEVFKTSGAESSWLDEDDHDDVLVLSYDEAIIISGDLEQFARNVWRAVFGTDPV